MDQAPHSPSLLRGLALSRLSVSPPRLLARVVAAIVQAGGRELRPEGQEPLLRLAELVIRAKEHFLISDQMPLLAGFEHQIKVEDQAVKEFAARDKPQLLAVVNHFAACPVGVVSNAIITAHGIKKAFGIDPTVVFGMGASVVTALRDRIGRTTDIVMVGGPTVRLGRLTLLDMRVSTSKEIAARLRAGESIFIYPEKGNSRKLLPGDFRSGRIILHAVEQGVPVLPVAMHFAGSTFYLSIGRFLDPQAVLSLANSTTDRAASGQQVVDYAMREIARQLPEHLRGPYGGH